MHICLCLDYLWTIHWKPRALANLWGGTLSNNWGGVLVKEPSVHNSLEVLCGKV